MAGFEIRGGSPGDARLVSELSERVFSEYTPGAGLRTLRMAQRSGARTLVAVVAGRPVGFAIVVVSSTGAHLDAIAVSEQARGRGVGRALLAGAEELAQSVGAPSLGLVTADSNLAALDLFLRAGYTLGARYPRYYERGQNAVHMSKRLKGRG